MSPKMTKKQAIQIATKPGEFSLAHLSRARARLEESLTKGTPGGFSEHMYVQDRARDLDAAITSRRADENGDEQLS